MNQLVLFDVDWTLLSRNSVHEKAFRHALRRVFGVDMSVEAVDHHGKTDAALIVEVLELSGIRSDKIWPRMGEIRELMATCFKNQVAESDARVLPGVPGVLKALEERGVLCGLATGNIEAIAWAKLGHYGLAEPFRVGGFGDEQTDRAQIIRAAVRQAEALQSSVGAGFTSARRSSRTFTRTEANVYHVGDTPHDLDAAHRAGVRGIGVATGIYDLEALGLEPHHALLPDLGDVAALVRAVGLAEP